jgi:hypothetical protein
MLKSHAKKILVVVAVLSGIVAAVPSVAHHGFTGAYDISQPIYISGTVRKVEVAYPHVEMTIEVTGSVTVPVDLPDIGNLGIENVMGIMTVAAPGSYDLEIAGLQTELDGRLAVGDSVALVALRNCLPPNQYRSRWVQFASGDVVTRAAGSRTQTEVNGCDS